jgi:hypothetical protein
MFREYFINEVEDKKQEQPKKIQKISKNFEEELRKYFKIKEVVYSSFGVQIDFFKKVSKEEIQVIMDPKVKIRFKDKSIFIEF